MEYFNIKGVELWGMWICLNIFWLVLWFGNGVILDDREMNKFNLEWREWVELIFFFF